MHKDIRFRTIICWIRHPAFLLMIISGTSLVVGTLLAAFSDFSVFSWMRLAVSSRLSIVCYLAAQLLPFLIAAYAAYISRLWLLHTVCAFKLFLFAYFGSLIWISFGSAGWLVRFLFLFSDIILTPTLIWFSTRRVLPFDGKRDLVVCLGIVSVTVLINLLFIAPFLERIIHN